MPCIRFNGGVICVSPEYAVGLHGRKLRFEMHSYFGPTFLLPNGDPVDMSRDLPKTYWQKFNSWLRGQARLKGGKRFVPDHKPVATPIMLPTKTGNLFLQPIEAR